jgi:hypothetical protein
MTIVGGSSSRYYACSTNRMKGTCDNKAAIKEPIARVRGRRLPDRKCEL